MKNKLLLVSGFVLAVLAFLDIFYLMIIVMGWNNGSSDMLNLVSMNKDHQHMILFMILVLLPILVGGAIVLLMLWDLEQ